MAETMTYDAGTDTVSTSENLTPDEQDSLQVGEAMEEQQESMLAGKYKNAQELENAYIELEKKLGEKSAPDSQKESSDEPEAEAKTDEKAEETADGYAFLEDLYEQASSEKGEISKEMIDKLSNMSKQDIIQNFLQFRADAESKYEAVSDLSNEQVAGLKNVVGGEQNYSNMLQWAQSNLSKQEIDMYDAVMEKGDPLACFFAVQAMKYRYDDQVGTEGRMLTGKAASNEGNQFKSQAQVIEAMNDPRYETDPAFRKEVADKLERSDVQF